MMDWLFGSRRESQNELATLRSLLQKCQTLLEGADRRADAAEQRYEALLAKYHEAVTPKPPTITTYSPPGGGHMAESGYEPKPVAPETPVKKKRESIVQQAIREEAGSDQRLAAYFRKRASDLRREGTSDADIVDAIHNWQTTEPVAEKVNES